MSKKDFFVGFANPIPPRLCRFYGVIIPLLLIAAGGLAWVLSKDTPAAGEGNWDLSEKVSFVGRVVMDPYPMLIVADNPERPVLVVRSGKRAARDILAPYAGQTVELSGFKIERGPWLMLELDGSEDVRTMAPLDIVAPLATELAEIELVGEIADSKCMLGVMKPGTGKVHRDCARMCILGGLPPMLLVTDAQGEKVAFLIVDAAGNAANQQVLGHIAVPVKVAGTHEKLGELSLLRVDFSNEGNLQPVK